VTLVPRDHCTRVRQHRGLLRRNERSDATKIGELAGVLDFADRRDELGRRVDAEHRDFAVEPEEHPASAVGRHHTFAHGCKLENGGAGVFGTVGPGHEVLIVVDEDGHRGVAHERGGNPVIILAQLGRTIQDPARVADR
jgi:hypothetical protein